MRTEDADGPAGAGHLREWEGLAVPGPGRWRIDPARSRVAFVVPYRETARLRGRFLDVSGTVEVGDRPEDSTLEARIGAASVRTGIPLLDRILRTRRLLDAARYPELRFRSTGVSVVGPRHVRLHGDLTVRDVTRPVVLNVEYGGSLPRPTMTAATFTARGRVDRAAFGLGWRRILGVPISGRGVAVELRVSIARDQP